MADHQVPPAWGDPATLTQQPQGVPYGYPPSPPRHPSPAASPHSSPPPSSSFAASTSALPSSASSPNVGNQPQVVEYEQSFGFVEVGEGELEGGGYKLKRNASTVVLTGDGLAQHQRQIESLERGMDDLRIEFERLKLQVLEFEEENHQWSLRYSRRMAVVANASLGAWIFWSRFILFVKRHKADLIQGWLRSSSASSSSPFSSSSSTSPAAVATRAAAPLLRRTKQSLVRQAIIGGGRLSKRATFNKLFTKGYMFAIRHSWVFLLSSYLITRKGARRWAGLIASTCYSVYLAFFTDTVPWTSYFTIFANLLYITACLKGMNDGEKEVPSLFNLHKGGREATLSSTSSSQSAGLNGSGGGAGSGNTPAMMTRNNSFVSRHTRNPSRSGRKISTPTPLSAFASASPTPSFSSPTTSFSSPSQSRQLAMAFSSSSSSPSTSSSSPVGDHRSPSPQPFPPTTRMRKNRSNVKFVLDDENDDGENDASAT
ncbi:uncharacterized protein ACA1_169720 [Acanthamoeba castellanii str. Neff]|uniref:Uncharacterized protein n=1 Tax=Acanthamoeba castellanii (strain ATCC 30010 / Neff) TaxID=1257118 RepID=L8HFH5_ACACF|nr:uncharacterized protein ACA1_169720 [Acanthamoeba castellanii str. Neff]ELR24274.1 hypothetical protein ACA1_169720 [Acanthamoeba castellanii str. Neff]